MADLQLFIKAVHFAAQKHTTQRRKNEAKTPYINHPLEVAQLISDVGGETDNVPLVAAVLHDTIEDTNATFLELIHEFGREIADVVMEVTDDKSLPKVQRKKLQVEHSKVISRNACLVKIADKISNLKDTVLDPPDWNRETMIGYAVWSRQIIDNMHGTNDQLEKLFYHWFNRLMGDSIHDYPKLLENYYQEMSI